MAQSRGRVVFKDKLATLDQVTLTLSNVPPAPAGKGYQAWLVSADGAQIITVGMLRVRPDGGVTLEWSAPSSENLVKRYAGVYVTVEPAAGSPKPSGKPILTGMATPDLWGKVQQLFVSNAGKPPTPLNTAFATGLVSQTAVALQHITNAANAAGIGSVPGVRAHLEHVINILEGKGGERFGDHDGDGVADNPGDGFGVRGYTREIIAAAGATAAEAGERVHAQIGGLVQKSVEATKVTDPTTLSAKLQELKVLGEAFKIEGVTALYASAQQVLMLEVKPAE